MKRRKCYVCVLLLLVMTLMLSGQNVDQEWSTRFTNDMRRLTGNRNFECMVDVDYSGSVDFWVTKSGDFNMVDMAFAIGWVAGIAIVYPEQANYFDVLYFKRSVDRFSMAEITAKECLLIYALMQRGVSEQEIRGIIEKTIRWTKGR